MIKLPDMEKFTHGLWPHAVAAIEAYSAEVQRLNATAQHLRPVELPGLKVCSSDYAGSQLWIESQVWNKAIDSCAEALRQQGYEVKS